MGNKKQRNFVDVQSVEALHEMLNAGRSCIFIDEDGTKFTWEELLRDINSDMPYSVFFGRWELV